MTVKRLAPINDCRVVRTHLYRLAALLALLAVLGCGESGPILVPVTGTVAVKGKPLAIGRIVFEPTAGNLATISAIGDVVGGEFSLYTETEGDGVALGKYYPTVLDPKGDTRKRNQRLGVVQLNNVVFEVTESGPNEFAIDITARDLEYAVVDD